jgi:hypothetical protein
MSYFITLKPDAVRFNIISEALNRVVNKFNNKIINVSYSPSNAQWSSGDSSGNRVPETYERVTNITGRWMASTSDGKTLNLNIVYNITTEYPLVQGGSGNTEMGAGGGGNANNNSMSISLTP